MSTNAYDIFTQQMATWNQNEKEILATFENYIHSTSQEKHLQVAEKLKTGQPSIILKYATASLAFKQFCEKELSHTDAWRKSLKESGCIGDTLISVDGKEICSTYQQYVAIYLYRQFEKFKTEEPQSAQLFLDEACRYHFFHALIKRCELNQEKFKQDLTTPASAQLEMDLQLISNLYWAFGSLRASRICQDIGNHFYNQNNEALEPIVKRYHQLAAEYFYRAMFISEWPLSKQVIYKIYKTQKLSDVFEYQNRLEAEDFLIHSIDLSVPKFERDLLRNKIRQEIFNALSHNTLLGKHLKLNAKIIA